MKGGERRGGELAFQSFSFFIFSCLSAARRGAAWGVCAVCVRWGGVRGRGVVLCVCCVLRKGKEKVKGEGEGDKRASSERERERRERENKSTRRRQEQRFPTLIDGTPLRVCASLLEPEHISELRHICSFVKSLAYSTKGDRAVPVALCLLAKTAQGDSLPTARQILLQRIAHQNRVRRMTLPTRRTAPLPNGRRALFHNTKTSQQYVTRVKICRCPAHF